MANMIARLGVVLGLDTAEFNKGIDAAGKKLEQFSEAAEKYGKVAATALVAASAAALNYADELADVAAANDVAIGTVLKLSDALANSGGKADNAGKMLSAFAKFIDEAADGSLKAQKTAAQLGVSLKDLGTLSQEELLNKVVVGLSEIEDPITRNAKAMEIFSKAAKGVDIVGFADQMQQANKTTQEQEAAIKAAADAYDILAQNSRDFMLILSTELGPVLKTTLEYIKSLQGEGNTLGAVFKTVFQTVAVLGANVAFVFKGISDEIVHTYQSAEVLVTKGIKAAILFNEQYDVRRKAERQNLDFFENQIMGVSTGRNANDPRRFDLGGSSVVGRSATAARDLEAERLAREAKREADRAERERQKLRKEYIDQLIQTGKEDFKAGEEENNAYAAVVERLRKQTESLKINSDLFAIENTMRNARPEDIKLTKELYLNEQKREEAIREIERNNKLSKDTKEYLVQQENNLAEATERQLRAQNEIIKKQREGSFQEGFIGAGAKFFRDLPTEMDRGAAAFDTVMGNMSSAIDNFVKTGKLSMKDLARSIIQDLIAIQMKAAAMRFLGSAFSMFSSGGFGTGNAFGNQDLGGFLAEGGPANANTPYIVGERGPELFVPRSSGTVVPNNQLGGMGGTTNVTNNYINAIDTKSFEDRLLGSSNAIWAANQYANKSLAVNRGRA